jgi:hypothetical protein
MEKRDPILWNAMHEKLKESMKKEISALREILANMHQEKEFIIINDRPNLEKILSERADMLGRLTALQTERIEAIKHLSEVTLNKKEEPLPSLEQLLPPEDAESCETLLLQEQLTSLKAKIDLQSHENSILSSQSKHNQIPPYLKKEVQPKKKIKVATATKKR